MDFDEIPNLNFQRISWNSNQTLEVSNLKFQQIIWSSNNKFEVSTNLLKLQLISWKFKFGVSSKLQRNFKLSYVGHWRSRVEPVDPSEIGGQFVLRIRLTSYIPPPHPLCSNLCVLYILWLNFSGNSVSHILPGLDTSWTVARHPFSAITNICICS